MPYHRQYLIQCTESGLFLRPSDDGDVTFCRLICDAGAFNDYESAFDTAQFVIGSDFIVFSFYQQG